MTEMQKTDINKEHAKRYLLKYIKELKIHFNLDEREIKDVLISLCYSKSRIYQLYKKIRKMLKKYDIKKVYTE